MKIGLSRRKKRHIVCTGSRPTTGAIKRETIEVNCVNCQVTIDVVSFLDSIPIEVVACPHCRTIFNRVTGKVLGEKGA